MNERIRQLLEQAKTESSQWLGSKPAVTITYDELEKFAELIVRECLTLTLGKDRRQLLDKGDLNGANLVQKDIIRVIEHFGVEQ